MRSIVIVCLVLILLMALLLAAVWYVMFSAQNVEASLPTLAQALKGEDWEGARLSYDQSKETWEKTKKVWYVLIDHEDMRDIEISFVDLDTAIRQQDAIESERELAELQFFLSHVPDTERVDVTNIF